MQISFAGIVLADTGNRLPPDNMTLNGQRVAEFADMARAASKAVYSRGNAATTFAFTVYKEFASYADAEDAYFLAESNTPVIGPLVIVQTQGGGRPVLTLPTAVCTGVTASLGGVRVTFTYSLTGGRFIGGLPPGFVVDPDSPNLMFGKTDIPNGQDNVSVAFPANLANPILGGLSIVGPAGADSPGILKAESLTSAGFTVFLTGAVPSAGFALHWQAKQGA